MFHHLHVLSLNPALPEQSSAGTREAVFPTPPARSSSFARLSKQGEEGAAPSRAVRCPQHASTLLPENHDSLSEVRP